jgi:hypothetical protein
MTNVDLIFVAIGIAVLVGLYFFYRGRRHTRRLFTALPRGKRQSSEPCHFLPAAGFSGLVCRAKEAHKLARILIFSIYDRRVKHPLSAAVTAPRPDDIREKLEQRLGRLHARQRLGIETDHEALLFGQGLNFFLVENFPFSPILIGGALRLSGLQDPSGRDRRCHSAEILRILGISAEVKAETRGFSRRTWCGRTA